MSGEYRSKDKKEEKKSGSPILAFMGIGFLLISVLTVVFGASEKHIENSAAAKTTPVIFSQASASPTQSVIANEIIEAPAVTLSPNEKTDKSVSAPLIYEKNADIFMASGDKTVKLGSRKSLYGCYKAMNCALSEDNRYLYYINGFDINTGEGDLNKVSTDAASAPIVVEEEVYAAQINSDGSSVMYIKNIAGITGDLYLLKNGTASLVDKNVFPEFMRFSNDGSCISYIVREASNNYALYIKINSGEPVLVTRIAAEASINDGIVLIRFSGAVPFSGGSVVYSVEENYNMPIYYYGADGKTEKICNDGYIIKTYTDGGFLFADIAENNLWYKSPGANAVNITQNYGYSKFAQDTNRFLLMEHIGDGANNSCVMMYEVSENTKKTAISLADDKIFEINSSFNCIVYERGGALYASHKTETGWKELYLTDVSEDKLNVETSKSFIKAQFDENGNNLYFFDTYKCGPLYRYSLDNGETVKLIDKADSLNVYGNIAYIHTISDKLYRVKDGVIKMICESVRDMKETNGGAFLLLSGLLEFIPEESQNVKLLDRFTSIAEYARQIEYRAPLEEDTTRALDILLNEVDFCLYKLGVYRDKTTESIDIICAIEIAQKLAQREDISEPERAIFQFMAKGFKAYEVKDRKTAVASLKNALSSYAEYLSDAGDDEAVNIEGGMESGQ